MGQVPQVLRYLLSGAAKDDCEVQLKEVRAGPGTCLAPAHLPVSWIHRFVRC